MVLLLRDHHVEGLGLCLGVGKSVALVDEHI
jgi:hypothetical protein